MKFQLKTQDFYCKLDHFAAYNLTEQLHFVLDCPLQTFLSLCVSYAREIPCML